MLGGMQGWCAVIADAGGHLWAAAADGSRVSHTAADGVIVTTHELEQAAIALAASSRVTPTAFALDRAGVVRELGADSAPVHAAGSCLAVDDVAGRIFTGSASGLIALAGGAGLWECGEATGALCLAADRRRLYAAHGASVTEVDPASGEAQVLACVPGAELGSLALAPGGLVGLDLAGNALIGINLRHGTSTRIFTGQWAEPVAVAYLRSRDLYVVAHADTPDLTLVSRDGSTARPLPLRYA